MQEESGDFDDVLCEIVENDGEERRVSVRVDPSLSCQPRADHASETQRERQYAYDRDFLQDPLLPCGGCDGIYRNGNGVAPTPGRCCSVDFYVFIPRGAGFARTELLGRFVCISFPSRGSGKRPALSLRTSDRRHWCGNPCSLPSP